MIEANTGDNNVRSIYLKYHKIRDYVEKNKFALVYCPSEGMLADILAYRLAYTVQD